MKEPAKLCKTSTWVWDGLEKNGLFDCMIDAYRPTCGFERTQEPSDLYKLS